VYEVGQDDDVSYYAMQFIQGQPLSEVLDELRRLRQASHGRRARDEGRGACNEAAEKSPSPRPSSLATRPSPSIVQSQLKSTEPAVRQSSRDSNVLVTPYSASGTRYHRTVARLGIQVAQALHYAHQEDVIHRDTE